MIIVFLLVDKFVKLMTLVSNPRQFITPIKCSLAYDGLKTDRPHIIMLTVLHIFVTYQVSCPLIKENSSIRSQKQP